MFAGRNIEGSFVGPHHDLRDKHGNFGIRALIKFKDELECCELLNYSNHQHSVVSKNRD